MEAGLLRTEPSVGRYTIVIAVSRDTHKKLVKERVGFVGL
jgi:hypothetical protein